MGMDFAKYYNATNILNQMIDEKDSKISCYKKEDYKGIYVCADTHDFWICRIVEGLNEEFEPEEGSWLVERNKIDKYDLLEFIQEDEVDKVIIRDRIVRDEILKGFEANDLIKHIILYDDNKGLEGWDNFQHYSLEECVESLDDGFGIIESTEQIGE